MRLIDADALYQSFGASGNCNNCPLDAYKCQYYNEHTLMEFCERIDDAPTVDAEPVRHGYWIDVNGDGSLWRCSVCGEAQCCYDNYCGNCGADMRGAQNIRMFPTQMSEREEEPEINPCRGCEDYDGKGGCLSHGGCGEGREDG